MQCSNLQSAINSYRFQVHGANMGLTWVLPAPDGPHVGPMNLAIEAVWRRDPVGDDSAKLVSEIKHYFRYHRKYGIVLLPVCTMEDFMQWESQIHIRLIFLYQGEIDFNICN